MAHCGPLGSAETTIQLAAAIPGARDAPKRSVGRAAHEIVRLLLPAERQLRHPGRMTERSPTPTEDRIPALRRACLAYRE